MKSIVVFCGSGDGYNEVYRETAYELGRTLAVRGISIIYGGAKMGLMGALADGALQHGGHIIGVIPDFLKTKEVVHQSLTGLITVDTMHERKLKMYELGDGIITMPGGWGTMEEMFEMLTWGQLGLHSKPVGLLNVNGYYDALKALCDNMVQEGFLSECTNATLLTSGSIEDLLEQMNNYVAPEAPVWAHARAENWLFSFDGEPLTDTLLYPNPTDTTGRRSYHNPGQPTVIGAKSNNAIYPNPVHDVLQVMYTALQADETITLEITDVSGKTVIAQTLHSGVQVGINVSSLVPGTYLYRISENTKVTMSGKITKD